MTASEQSILLHALERLKLARHQFSLMSDADEPYVSLHRMIGYEQLDKAGELLMSIRARTEKEPVTFAPDVTVDTASDKQE